MVRTNTWLLRAGALSVVAMLIAACGGTQASPAPGTGGPAATSGPVATVDPSLAKKGGTIYILTQSEQWNHVDPQRVYTGEDLAFFSGTIMRSLTAYKFSADPTEGTSLQPDLATDLGTSSEGGKVWSFTLRDGVTWQDGSDVTCEDVKYGVSRTFATDVINQGPTYAVVYLDIPTEEDGSSAYKGPYGDAVGQELYDAAVTCDGKTITFNLAQPIADFNYTVTLGFSPVRESDDTGEKYGTVAPYIQSNGPYQVESYTTGNGGKMVLVRNPNWNEDSDFRPAYPDKWEIHFGIDPKVLDQRIMQGSGNDAFAVQYGGIQPENLGVVFVDNETPTEQYAGRAISGFDPYSRYYWIDNVKVPNPKIRQAMAVALDREAIRLNTGGEFAGGFADGLVKPNIGGDYAPTGFWDTFFGKEVSTSGDPELAMQLIAESGEPAPKLVFNISDTPVNAQTAAIVIDSLGKAGFTVTPAPLPPGQYYSIVFDPEQSGDFGLAGWGADWPNASTVLPPLLTDAGGWNLSRVDDPTVNTAVTAGLTELDRPTQQKIWQDLNKYSAEQVNTLPTFFGLSQTIGGTKVGPLYRWAAYGSWPYGEMYVTE
ncbi:MAG TPA: ABC transporter substrate-binding protein [Candidatus Limnocylindria bacterium]|nr:ABC transporter substrate-binding protein [Candidatus Limnocylindria bacterium]